MVVGKLFMTVKIMDELEHVSLSGVGAFPKQRLVSAGGER